MADPTPDLDLTDIERIAAAQGIGKWGLREADDQELIDELQQRGYLSHKPEPAIKPVEFDMNKIRGDRLRIGIISDTHFGSKFQQPTHLLNHMKYMARREVDVILHAGDVTDGATRMHPGFEYEIWAHGTDAQIDAAAEVLVPQIEAMEIPMFLIGGNHDHSHYRQGGTDVVALLCERSEYLNYLTPGGSNSRNSTGIVEFGTMRVQVVHPHMGSAYALSYRPQKWIEQLAPENKPNIVIMGNFHKTLQLHYRNVFAMLVPSFQAQSGWMASKGIASDIGSAILEVGLDQHGLAPSVQTEWLLERIPIENDWPGGKA